MYLIRKIAVLLLVSAALLSDTMAQKFLPDDPIEKDPDNLTIEKPVKTELGKTWDFAINSFGSEAEGTLMRAQNINTLGQVPDSSWFTNRIGARQMTIDELKAGNDVTGGPDLSKEIRVTGAALLSVGVGLIIQDSRGDSYYLMVDPKDYPGLVTGSSLITNRLFHAAGYNVFPNYIIDCDPAQFRVDPGARVFQLGGKSVPLDQEFIRLFLDEAARQPDGSYRGLAIFMVPGAEEMTVEGNSPYVGEFQFHGRRPDDPNDIYLHENRRELRGLRLFAGWLNFTLCNALATRDVWIEEDGNKFLKHYFIDFTGALGSGLDWEDRPVPKDSRSGNEYFIPGDLGATLKTAVTLGFWYRPWMKIDYASDDFPEIGRIESSAFEPDAWVPEYPNAAFTRMLPDDAFWAARIIDKFSDEAVQAIVEEAQFSDPQATRLLVEILKARRDRIVSYYFRQVNPLVEFKVEGQALNFSNRGEERGLATINTYEYEWFELNNQDGELTSLADRQFSPLTRVPIPRDSAEYLMVRLRTRSDAARGWKKNVDVYLRMNPTPHVVGIERETGVFVLDRSLEGLEVVRSSIEFAGTFEGLDIDQRRLITSWIRRAEAVTNRTFDAEQIYSDLPMSTRTTYEAVTHALMESVLTDENGAPLGRAFDLIAELERVNGKIKGVGGDQQFRMYVALVPDTIETLEKSTQFARGADNTIYHKGYPLNYRQQGGVPSIQISIAEDERRADIDVDYRSSKFPNGLFNGHLTSANSDVRAGNNHQRHINRWEGFLDWWRGIFGLPQMRQMFGVDEPERLMIPRVPRLGDAKEVEDAIEDFLKVWLVEGESHEAVAYIAEKAYYCMDLGDEGTEVDFGIAPIVLLDRMEAARNTLGNPERLERVILPVSLTNPRLKPVERKNKAPFVLYDVPEDLAFGFDCASRNQFEPARQGSESRYGRYFGAAFQFIGLEGKSGKAVLLWSKVEGYWKIISYEIEPEGEDSIDSTFIPPPSPVADKVAADPSFLEANRSFLQAWGNGRIDEAQSYIDRSCLDCYNLYKRDDQPPAETWEQARAITGQGLERVSSELRQAESILDVIEPVEAVHPDVRVVAHESDDKFTIISLPSHLAQQYNCSLIVNDQVDYREPAEMEYGKYFATAIRFKLSGEEPAVLYLIWSEIDGDWRISSYAIVRP